MVNETVVSQPSRQVLDVTKSRRALIAWRLGASRDQHLKPFED